MEREPKLLAPVGGEIPMTEEQEYYLTHILDPQIDRWIGNIEKVRQRLNIEGTYYTNGKLEK